MADVKLKDLVGIERTYNDINSVELPSADGEGTEVFIQADEFDGSYSVTPTGEDITMSTKDKFLNDDIVVNAIPYAETSNDAGGTTVTIGSANNSGV